MEQLHPTRRRREAVVGILGVEPDLDGVAHGWGRLAFEPAAASDVQLHLHEVDAGRGLGHRMLDLQPRVHLHEVEGTRLGLEQELDRPGIAVARRPAQPNGGHAQLLLQLGVERRRRRLLQHLLVAALDGAVAHAHGPAVVVTVGQHLHLDVARAHDRLLEEHGGIAEELERLGACAAQRVRQLVGGAHAAYAATAPACGGLEHDRIAEASRMAERVFDRLDRPAAPWRHRYLRALGHSLRGDLVAEPAHGVAIRTDEHDPELVAQVGELGMLRHEAPAHPRRLGAAVAQRALERPVVEVLALALAVARVHEGGGPEAHRLLGLADEHAAPVGLGVERDGVQSEPMLLVELAHGVHEPHRGLAAVDDGNALEGQFHRCSLDRPLGRRWGSLPLGIGALSPSATAARAPP